MFMLPTMRYLHPLLLIFFSPLIGSLVFGYYDATPDPSRCASSEYKCGDQGFNVSYPFLLPTSPSYCGHPDFEVECSSDNKSLVARIDGKRYRVNSIDYESQLVHVTDPGFLDQACHQTFANTSIDPSLFGYSSDDAKLTILFKPPHSLYNITCPESDSDHQSFYGYPFPGMVKIMRADDNRNDLMGMSGAAVKSGFGMHWKPGDEWCRKCTASKGICWNHSSPACYCSNGTSSINGVCVVITSCKDCRESNGQYGYNIDIDKFMCICPDRAHYRSCLPVPASDAGVSKKNFSGKGIIGVVVSVVGAFIVVGGCLALFFRNCRKRQFYSSSVVWKRNLNNNRKIETFLEEYGSIAPKRYSYSKVKKITKSFQEKLGQGGFGTVFKGTLSDGHVVAVKILKDSKGDGEEFINEVAGTGRTSHVNVVSLLGFCAEGSKRALIYDFMCNGSLDKLLNSGKPKTALDWDNLYQITIGIARGLEYLHRGCNTRMVHFDIKPHNILLDQDFCPKISDFGLAKLCLKKESVISIAGARGTIGYIAPEVFSRNFGVVSSKSDVYSYGMMVLEIAGGRKNPNEGVENSSEIYFPHWIYARLDQNGDILSCGVTAESEETVRKMVLVGLWCIQTMPENRPSMSRVIEMMEGNVNDLRIPPKPYLSSSPLGSIIGTSSILDTYIISCNSPVHS